MSPLSEAQKLATGKYIMCACHNAYELSKSSCPFCRKFNHASSDKHCSLCGSAKVNWINPDPPKPEPPVEV